MSGIVDKISNLVVGDKSQKMDPKDEVFVGSIGPRYNELQVPYIR